VWCGSASHSMVAKWTHRSGLTRTLHLMVCICTSLSCKTGSFIDEVFSCMNFLIISQLNGSMSIWTLFDHGWLVATHQIIAATASDTFTSWLTCISGTLACPGCLLWWRSDEERMCSSLDLNNKCCLRGS
jgi:hypothetical protein